MNIHIGFVEDDDVIRENYTEILQDEGFKVTAFSGRHEALKCFKICFLIVGIPSVLRGIYLYKLLVLRVPSSFA